jgi:hypothetical protein
MKDVTEGELERNFIPDLIFTKNRKRTIYRGPGDKGHNWMAEKAYWIRNQCWRKIQSQMATFHRTNYLARNVQADVEQELQK